MKKIITALTTLCIVISKGIAVQADEMLDKDYIKSKIWEDFWYGKNDDGTEYPEASYKYHLIDKWVDENYNNDKYDWSAIGELRYDYKRYYNKLIENWDFNDDDNGNWTIDTEDNAYHFQLINGQWNMLDQNNNVVDMFIPISTAVEETHKTVNNPPNEDGNNNRVIGIVTDEPYKASESDSASEGKITSNIQESRTEPSDSVTMPLIISGALLISSGAGIVIYKKKTCK